MKVLVTGSRDWDDRSLLFSTLDGYRSTIDEIIEGCARGADQMAEEWARLHHVSLHHFPADWKRIGRAAGPVRNREMLAHHPDLVIAFHHDLESSKGTADMVRIAKLSGVDVILIA
jgi:hypothetical protein